MGIGCALPGTMLGIIHVLVLTACCWWQAECSDSSVWPRGCVCNAGRVSTGVVAEAFKSQERITLGSRLLNMGFALQISSISEMVSSEEDERLLLEFLKRNNIQFRDRFDPAAFDDPFFEVETFEDDEEEAEEAAYVAHPELGWSWWSKVQEHMVELLGAERVTHALAIHAWYGVAIPDDVQPTLLGRPEERKLPARKPSLLERLGLKPKT